MNRFDTTFVVSIDGIFNNTTLQFFDQIPQKMAQAGVPFTQHWEKTTGYTPARVQNAYGADFAAWTSARHQLLPDPADRALFTNDYIQTCGLDA